MNATSQPETQSISLEYELPYPPAKVWRALTEPKLLKAWLMENDIEPLAGRNFTFRSKPTPWWDGIVRCEVLASEPHRLLRYSWRSGTAPSGLDTVVTWTLTPTPSGGTRLALEHSGFRSSDRQAFDGASQGWHRMVGETLRKVLENVS
jgi:uncharacterized protein YndB with AHSA1/START domain